jgi:hypothetical protein
MVVVTTRMPDAGCRHERPRARCGCNYLFIVQRGAGGDDQIVVIAK